jgi:sensor c-di-GMP phosphodiesterase-like protein
MERRMNKTGTVLLASAVGVLALLVPFSLSLLLAQIQGREDVLATLHDMADDVLERADTARLQISDAISALNNDPAGPPCSTEQLARMSMLSGSFSHVAGMGRLEGNALTCTTLGTKDIRINLGTSDANRQSGLHFWSAVELPGMPGQGFSVVGRDGYAALADADLGLDLLNRDSAVSLAFFIGGQHQIVGHRGVIRGEWASRYRGEPIQFEDNGYLVVIRPSQTTDSAALAAIPSSLVAAQVRRSAYVLGPVGLALGVLLTGAVGVVARRRLSLSGELQAAFERDEFFVEYQPIIDLRNGRCVGAEALARWRNEDGVLVSPNVFIPLAEAQGMIGRITARVMEIVVREAAGLLRANPGVHISINLSSEDLHSHDAQIRMRELAQRAEIEPASLMFEITERGLMAPEKARNVLLAVRAGGFRMAIDDFGTGHSNLSYLATYELDFLKIDKMFVDTLGTEAPTSLVTFHIIDLARSLGMQVIAEGVETEAQRDILQARGVQYAQGWLFGRPMSIQELQGFIAQVGPGVRHASVSP